MSSMPPPPPPPPPSYAPTQPPLGRQYASFGARLGAHIIDNLLYGALLAVFLVPGIIMVAVGAKDCAEKVDAANGADVTCTGNDINAGLLAGGVGLILLGVVVVAVIYLRSLGRTGQTWGRRMVGIRVVRQNSTEPLGVGLALGRYLLEGILGQLCLLNYLWMLWDKDNQTWHDKIVHTIVVRA
jgi:uncharacterized RDD family membrane protein YckC